MQESIDPSRCKADMLLPWLLVGLVVLVLLVLIVTSLISGEALQHPLPEHQRILVRTLLYVLAIIMLPVTNLLRYIQLRLAQTMPGTQPSKNRYQVAVAVSMAFVTSIGCFGFIMYIFGDGYNTLYIFILVSALGAFLYRPKLSEYLAIIEARNIN